MQMSFLAYFKASTIQVNPTAACAWPINKVLQHRGLFCCAGVSTGVFIGILKLASFGSSLLSAVTTPAAFGMVFCVAAWCCGAGAEYVVQNQVAVALHTGISKRAMHETLLPQYIQPAQQSSAYPLGHTEPTKPRHDFAPLSQAFKAAQTATPQLSPEEAAFFASAAGQAYLASLEAQQP